MDGMGRAARAATELLQRHRRDTVHIVTHIDADALAAAGIAATCLRRAGIAYRVTYCKSLDEAKLGELRAQVAPLAWSRIWAPRSTNGCLRATRSSRTTTSWWSTRPPSRFRT